MLQYPAGSKMRSACAWVYTFGTHGVVVEVGGGGVLGFAGTLVWVYILREIPFLNTTPELGFDGGVTTPWYCCILSKRVVNAASCASMFDMSVLSLVAAFAMLSSAVAMASLVIFVRRSTLASRYLVCQMPTFAMPVVIVPTPEWLPGSGGRQRLANVLLQGA